MMADEPMLREIDFEGWGDIVLNNWGENTDSLEAIIKAFKNSDISEKIKYVYCDNCNIEPWKLKEIWNKNKIVCNNLC